MFTGSIVALITPMDNDGKLDRKSLKKIINYHIMNGTSAIVSVGTTGESATLNHHEHVEVVMETLAIADGRIPIIAGTGSNATSEAIALTKEFYGTGVAACLSVTPYYNKPTQEGLFQHYKCIAESTDLPQILYNVPSRTGCDLLPETVAKLAEIDNIIAIKEATCDLRRIGQIQTLIDTSFTLLSGDDATALAFMQLGGHGVISVVANVAAKKMTELCQLVKKGKFLQAYQLNHQLMVLYEKLFIETNPIPVKWACHKLKLIESPTMRLPMTPLSESGKYFVEQALKKIDLI